MTEALPAIRDLLTFQGPGVRGGGTRRPYEAVVTAVFPASRLAAGTELRGQVDSWIFAEQSNLFTQQHLFIELQLDPPPRAS